MDTATRSDRTYTVVETTLDGTERTRQAWAVIRAPGAHGLASEVSTMHRLLNSALAYALTFTEHLTVDQALALIAPPPAPPQAKQPTARRRAPGGVPAAQRVAREALASLAAELATSYRLNLKSYSVPVGRGPDNLTIEVTEPGVPYGFVLTFDLIDA